MRRARLAWRPRAGQPAPPVGDRDRLRHRRGRARATGTASAGPTMREDYDVIRDHISRVVAGLRGVHREGRPPRWIRASRTLRATRARSRPSPGSAEFVCSPIDVLQVPEGHVLLQTLRSHDQFNTTIYGFSDRYRGIEGGRRVVFMHPDDIAAPRLPRRRHRRSDDPLGRRRHRTGRAGLPHRGLRHPAGLGSGLLPRDQPAGAARLHRHGQQLPHVEVGHHQSSAPARQDRTITGRTRVRRATAQMRGTSRGHSRPPVVTRGSEQVRRLDDRLVDAVRQRDRDDDPRHDDQRRVRRHRRRRAWQLPPTPRWSSRCRLAFLVEAGVDRTDQQVRDEADRQDHRPSSAGPVGSRPRSACPARPGRRGCG